MSQDVRTTCPFCSLHCADLRLVIDGGRLVAFSPACTVAESGFRSAFSSLIHPRPSKKALQTARRWLEQARQPLIVVSGDMDQGPVRAALRMARQHSAILTGNEDLTGAVLGQAVQAAGYLTATLGDFPRTSQIVLCGADPVKTHPRLGEMLGCGLPSRAVTIDPGDPVLTLRRLRMAISGCPSQAWSSISAAVDCIRDATSGLVIFGSKWLRLGQPFAAELMAWLNELGREKRWFGMYLPPASNSTGVVETFLSETGYPGNLRFSADGVDFSPGLCQAGRLIRAGETDLCLLLGSPFAFIAETMSCLAHIRTILIAHEPPAWKPDLWLPVARAGIDASGQVQRLDGLPVDLQPVLSSRLPGPEQILFELTGELTV